MAVFGDFRIEIDDDVMTACLTGDEGIFANYPPLSGVVLVIERSGTYAFRYFSNRTLDPSIVDQRMNGNSFA